MTIKNPTISRRSILGLGAMAGVAGIGGLNITGRAALAAESSEPLPVNIVTTSGSSSSVLNELMRRLGYMQKLNLKPELLTVSDGSKTLASLISGASDICVGSGISQIFPAMERGGKVKVLAGASLLPLSAIFTTRPDIKQVSDLVGKTVGTGSVGSLEHQLIMALLKKKGIDPARVTFANIGGTGDIFRAVAAGNIDAGPGTIEVYEAQQKYGVHSLTDGRLWVELPEFVNQGTYCSEAALNTKRDALVRVLAAYARLYRYIQSPESKDTFVAAQVAALSKPNPAEALHQWNFIQEYKPYAVDLVLTEDRLNYMQELNVSFGMQKKVVPFNVAADMSLAREALKLVS
jgi:ABC-type nitrate/sulfonate/bicarbonate transport system substrate-binding protein